MVLPYFIKLFALWQFEDFITVLHLSVTENHCFIATMSDSIFDAFFWIEPSKSDPKSVCIVKFISLGINVTFHTVFQLHQSYLALS